MKERKKGVSGFVLFCERYLKCSHPPSWLPWFPLVRPDPSWPGPVRNWQPRGWELTRRWGNRECAGAVQGIVTLGESRGVEGGFRRVGRGNLSEGVVAGLNGWTWREGWAQINNRPNVHIPNVGSQSHRSVCLFNPPPTLSREWRKNVRFVWTLKCKWETKTWLRSRL